MKFAKVMFLHLSVSHSVHRGVGGPRQVHPTWAGTPPGQVHPPGQVDPLGRYIPHPPCRYTPLGRYTPDNACRDTANRRAVHILLECILVCIQTVQYWISVCLIFLQSSSIDFLVSQNFDFNKVFREGTFISALAYISFMKKIKAG